MIIANSVVNIFRFEYLDFLKSQKSLFNLTNSISRQANSQYNNQALKKLGKNKINGFYYRFDDHLDDAELIRDSNSVELHDQQRGNYFEFNDAADIKMKPRDGNYALENGILKYEFGLNRSKFDCVNFLENTRYWILIEKNISSVEIKMKVRNTTEIDIGYSSMPDADPYNHYQTEFITLTAIPDNSFHIYTIDGLRFEKVGCIIRNRSGNSVCGRAVLNKGLWKIFLKLIISVFTQKNQPI
ncbi:MAG: hypothetical protein R2874_00660 [Desulfobacterales bacterium]